MGEISSLLIILMLPLLAFLPTIIAIKKKHPYKVSIIYFNIIAGLLFLFVFGWPGVLVWLGTALRSCVVPNQKLTKGMMVLMFLLVIVGARLALAFSPLVWGWSVDGSVTDAESGKPLADTWVVVQWEGTDLMTSGVCVHVAVTKTDAQGHYHVPAWIKDAEATAFYLEHRTDAYKANYIYAQPKRATVNSDAVNDIWLGKFTGAIDKRMDYLERMRTTMSCGFAGASGKNLYPVYVDIYEEAQSICNSGADFDSICQDGLRRLKGTMDAPWISGNNTSHRSNE